ncbi:MAG: hypothetical protein IKX65_02705 [Prevotella sp.]|nr:hypothetical protein [Prevotella sp.]
MSDEEERKRKRWLTPKGQRLVSHTKTLMEGGFCPESVTSSPYRGRLGGGGCFFCLFSLRQRKRGEKEERSASFLCTREKEGIYQLKIESLFLYKKRKY